jgi:hypothetical protein
LTREGKIDMLIKMIEGFTSLTQKLFPVLFRRSGRGRRRSGRLMWRGWNRLVFWTRDTGWWRLFDFAGHTSCTSFHEITEGNMMRTIYWNFLWDMKYHQSYYERCRTADTYMDWFFTGFSLTLSATGLVAFLTANSQWLGGALLIVGQVISTVSHLLPFPKRIQTLTYLLDDLKPLVVKINWDWNKIDTLSSDGINNLILEHETELARLESHYLGSIPIPIRKRYMKYAADEADRAVANRYPLESPNSEDCAGKEKPAGSAAKIIPVIPNFRERPDR